MSHYTKIQSIKHLLNINRTFSTEGFVMTAVQKRQIEMDNIKINSLFQTARNKLPISNACSLWRKLISIVTENQNVANEAYSYRFLCCYVVFFEMYFFWSHVTWSVTWLNRDVLSVLETVGKSADSYFVSASGTPTNFFFFL